MTKYRLLNNEELQSFEDEFVKYLVVNGIAADDWKKMLDEKPEAAQQIVDLFSDVVFEKIMRSAKFLQIKRKSYVQAIQCLEDKMVMVALSTKNPDLDLQSVDWTTIDYKEFEIHSAEKSYEGKREEELYKLTEIGYYISEGDLFKALMLAAVQD
ncbi:MAG: hypothetical protein BM555_05090 [Crocinitomix sp. MedPE-SWsnd]|jgi:Family of unknown function (DUF6495)|nr:MAG: hypothetical protein BM555_05090 [Crocinitomix sp. MedPE-SWsnd]